MTPSARSSSRLARELRDFDAELIDCRRCPRLVQWREDVAVTKRASFADEEYWGRPVPSFGSLDPKILIVGLAPAAHGANRTGRMFTGDRSGDWLFASLHRCGLASSPTSISREDGQSMELVRITAAVHCAPPGNAPTLDEKQTCATWLDREFAITWPHLSVVIALGGIAHEAALRAAARTGIEVPKPKPKFGHGSEAQLGAVTLLGSYHPSQQNTFTGRLTAPMLDAVITRAKRLASA